MDNSAEGDDQALVDLTELPLPELPERDDSPFVQSLRRVQMQAEQEPSAMVVGFQSSI